MSAQKQNKLNFSAASVFQNLMQNVDSITIGLIIAGAVILLLAMLQTHRIFRLVEDKRFKRSWRNLFVLMSFFFVSYFIAVYFVGIGEYSILQVLTGVIFFFGAVFVFVVAAMGLSAFKLLQKANNDLKEKVGLLKTQNDQLTQFNYATTHDLKEPINTVIGSTTIIKNNYGDKLDEKGIQFLDFTLKAADRMTELVTGLSDYLKVGHGAEKSMVDINQLVSTVLEELHGSIEASQASVKLMDLPKLQGIEKELKRVFQNLISNALKYRKSDVKPEIEISALKNDNAWEFNIQDNGIGIKKEHFPQVFQLFRRLHKDQFEGTGIGLAITKKAIELHGGDIWLESQEGIGTTFRFTIAQ